MPSRQFDRRFPSAVVFVRTAGASPALAQAQTPAPTDHSTEAVVIEQARALYRFERDGKGLLPDDTQPVQ